MKLKPVNLLLAITLFGGIAMINNSQATPVMYEGANYPLDTINPDPDAGLNSGNGLPATNDGGNPADTSTGLRGNHGTEYKVVAGLTYSNAGGTLATTGGALRRFLGTSWSAGNPFVYRRMVTDPFISYRTPDQTIPLQPPFLGWNGNYATELYYSVLLNSAVITGTNELVVKVGRDTNDFNTFLSQVGGTWRWSDALGGQYTWLEPAVAGQTVMFVARMGFESATSFTMDYWLNPPLGQALPAPDLSVNYNTSTLGGQFRSLQTRVAAVDVFTFDEWRMGTTATSVMPVAGAIAPAAPSSLVATASSFTAVQLNWSDNSNNEIDFVIQRSLTGTGGWRQIAVPIAGQTSYSDTGLNALTTYHYRILAANGGGASAYSANATVTTPSAPVATPPPTNLASIVDSFSEITLTWTDNTTDETNFVIERSLDGTTGWSAIATLGPDITLYQNVGLTAASTYYYRVYANAPGGTSAFSGVASATTAVLPPESPLEIKLPYIDADGTSANMADLVPGIFSYTGQGTILTTSALTYPGLNSSGNGLQTITGQRHYIKIDTSIPGLARYVSGGQIGGSGLGVLYVRWLASGIDAQQYNAVEFRTDANDLPFNQRARVGPSAGLIQVNAASTASSGITTSVNSTIAPSASGTDLYVVKFTFSTNGVTTMDLFVNQTTEGTPAATVTGAIQFNTICFGGFNTTPAPSLDEFRIGTSFANVVDAGSQPAGFASWATANGVTGGVAGDSDNDGIINAMEYALVTNLTGSNGSLGTFNGSLLTYTKRQAAINNQDVTYVIETSPNLLPPWTTQVTQAPGNAEPTISYTLPASLGKMFARLRVVVN